MSVEQLVLIIVLIIAVLTAFLIPAILQIKKTAKSAEDFMKATQESLNPLLSELRQTIEKTNRAAEGVEESVRNVQRLTKSVGETGALVEEVNNLLRQTGLSCAVKTASIGVGVKTAISVLAKGLIKKGGEKDE
ncbi:MAG: DUF948 domain-containing protein [Nitrospirae bacterium]|nr:DUF948 domain-containing protein [Nitrospirota bacterium]